MSEYVVPAKSDLDPTDGHLLAGTQISEHQFLARVRTAQLFQITLDPRDSEDPKKVANDKDLQELLLARKAVQRPFEKQKRDNLNSYTKYIIDMHKGNVEGITPPIMLYSRKPLRVKTGAGGLGYIQVPFGLHLMAIDGETQLGARFEGANACPDTREDFVAVMISHGKDTQWAQQSFHDLNVLGVRPNSALAIGMDARDPLTHVSREVERRVAFFKDRVHLSGRQLGKDDREVVTLTALRGACITFAEGIGGVRHGARPVILADESKLPQIEKVAVEWFDAIARSLGVAIEDRLNKIASSPAVFVAIGAVGHELLQIDDDAERQVALRRLIRMLQGVDWSRGPHWESIAGKFTPKGKFSLGGPKEVGYAVFDALANCESPAFAKVRLQSKAAA